MDLTGSLVDTNLKIYPTKPLLDYLKSLTIDNNVPENVVRLVKGKNYESKQKKTKETTQQIPVHLDSKDIENLNKIKALVKIEDSDIGDKEKEETEATDKDANKNTPEKDDSTDESEDKTKNEKAKEGNPKKDELYLSTSDINWLYLYLQKQRDNGSGDKMVPYLHVLLEGADIETPVNQILKRNPILEARCVKLRAQQEAREYRKMTKTVDNVRMKFPEDSINYQLKQLNRQLIAIGQFIISIFAGFLFGFRGVEWMVGNLDFGFRLLLGVMCALVIALAEIYFLAKKLNEELNVPETVQIGGPPKFVDPKFADNHPPKISKKAIDKEHQD